MNPVDRYLPFGLTLDTLVVYMVGLVTFLCIVVAWRALIDDDSRLARQRIIARRRDELRLVALGPKRRSTRRRALPLAALTRRWQLVQTAQADRIRMRLLRAGLRSREALAGFLVAKLVLPSLFLGVAFVLIYLVQIGLVSPRLRPLTLPMATILGFFAPDIYVSNLQTKRRQALQKALPDGLDLLVICAEAGLSLDAALNRVADEIGPSAPELSAELALTSVELNFLPDRRQALLNLGSRCDLASIRGVVNTLVQTENALVGIRGVGLSCDQGCDEGAEEGFAAAPGVVHELEEAEIERQLLLRDAPVRAQPGAQQGPDALHGVDVDLAEAVAILVAGVLAAPVADRLVPIAPGRQAGVDVVLVGVDAGALGDGGLDDRLDRLLLHIGQHAQDHLPAALDQAEDGWLVLRQRAAARRACQPAAAAEPPLLATAAGWPLCPATT